MISKRIDRQKENDNYGNLAQYVRGGKTAPSSRQISDDTPDDYGSAARYISDSEHGGEKVLYAWHSGCQADSWEMSIREVLATQSLNTTSRREKTYHMIVSFHPEDESKLTEDVLKDIAQAFADGLDYEEHQRHCGVHKNTAHIHMHIAFNKIHPTKFTSHDPFRDFQRQADVCRALEQKYGFVIDNGLTDDRTPTRPNTKAQAAEAHSGQESFDTFARKTRQDLLDRLDTCANWDDFHASCARFGFIYIRRANGAVFKDRHGKFAVKASSVDRLFSLKALEKRFGMYATPSKDFIKLEEMRYTSKPVQRGSERDRGLLFQEYRNGIERRKKILFDISEETKKRSEHIKKHWELKRFTIKNNYKLTKTDKNKLIAHAKLKEQEALEKMRVELAGKRKEVRKKIPFTTWNSFLKHKAVEGNELALAILRSKKIEAQPEMEQEEYSQDRTSFYKAKLHEIRSNANLTAKDRNSLIAVAKMFQLLERGQRGLDGFRYTIDNQGVVLFYLASGGQIRDNGKEISFSAHDPAAKLIAGKFASLRFGRASQLKEQEVYVGRKDNQQQKGQER